MSTKLSSHLENSGSDKKIVYNINPARKRKANEAFATTPVENPRNHTPSLSGGVKVITFNENTARLGETAEKSLSTIQTHRSTLKERALRLLPARKTLPIYPHSESIRKALREHDVLLLAGETGSGKSTQVPQFLAEEPWCKSTTVSVTLEKNHDTCVKVGGCIAITQPRRVAAISLAKRVAEEMGSLLGNSSPASKVGYSVRFDNSTSPATRIKFLTEGMLLQEMLKDPWLTAYSAVIVDEVHERGANVDLILGFLRQLHAGQRAGRGDVKMKIVIMSATADMEGLRDYFRGTPTLANLPVDEVSPPENQSHESELSNLSNLQDKVKSRSKSEASKGFLEEDSPSVATLKIKGRQYPVQTTYKTDPVADWIDSAFQTIVDIHLHQPLPGDILVFLTGQETVEMLQSYCKDFAGSLLSSKEKRMAPKLLPLPLFAALPHQEQQRVFQPAPTGTRRVILATNIAETSVTVPGVRFVIDSGKCKKKQFRSQLNLDSLLVKPVSKSSANQRRGRAGREAPGLCYRLYTESEYLKFAQDNDPEILRCDLSQVVLSLKARGVNDIGSFPFLTAPRRSALERAVFHLLQLGALDPDSGAITPIGREIALLPLPPNLGRVLLASREPEYDCLFECIDIISALSVENVFQNLHSSASEAQREAVEEARRELFRREGDHLTLLACVQTYVAENSDRKRWCQERSVSHRAMQAVMDVRKQLRALMSKKTHLGPGHANGTQSRKTFSGDDITLPSRILRAFLTGFMGNVAVLTADGSFKTLMGSQVIGIHPSSVLFGRKLEGIMYNEFVYTQKAYARSVSAIELDWLEGER